MKTWVIIILVLNLFFGLNAYSQNNKVLGKWQTVDESGQAKSHVELYMKDGKMFGKVVELLPAATTKVCINCPGDKNGKSLIGMDIIWNMGPVGTGWEGGQIVDPKNGKIYSCEISLDGADKLKVRGYMGLSILGRTQIWNRAK